MHKAQFTLSLWEWSLRAHRFICSHVFTEECCKLRIIRLLLSYGNTARYYRGAPRFSLALLKPLRFLVTVRCPNDRSFFNNA